MATPVAPAKAAAYGKVLVDGAKLRCWPSQVASPPVYEDVVAKDQVIGLGRVEGGFRQVVLPFGPLGYVNKKGAESRAQAEVAALSAAIESFKLGEGFYPTNAAALYTNLCPAVDGRKVYFEPAPSMVTNNKFIDPWGSDYVYSNYTSYFELWSTAGGANSNNWIRN